MELFGRRKVQVALPHGSPADAPAIRDASAILARAKADEAAANQAREAYRTHPMPTLEPDARIAPLLGRGERVVAVRRSAQLDRRQPIPGWEAPPGIAGDLYLTPRRLVLVGRMTMELSLNEIEEAGLSGERLLLALRDGQSVSLDVEQPRLLRVDIATARALARADRPSGRAQHHRTTAVTRVLRRPAPWQEAEPASERPANIGATIPPD